MQDYRETTLWKTAFGDANITNQAQKNARDDLLKALRDLEDRVTPLLAKIDASCRELTIHDISHVHQLWDVASQICGPDYPLNPLEGFVLGAAFLIHDSGLTAAAYPNGMAGIKATTYYKDRVAALLKADNDDLPDADAFAKAPEIVAQQALFDTLRAIHAKRAETLLDQQSPHPLTGHPYPLFPEPDLFLDCGEIIGRIAASHHWNINGVEARFSDLLTPPAKFPGWPIDALKLACILRAADACAIDERRARIMPFLLTNPTGVSRDHWLFQANLKPGERHEEAIIFQSKKSFSRREMSAWWVAYDAIGVADRELNDCDRVLRANSNQRINLEPFKARRVDGAAEPSRLAHHVRVSGWEPVDTSVRIDNPISLIEKLGGWRLYGHDYLAPLRELLQNAADSIRARRTRANGYSDNAKYPGRIDIRIDEGTGEAGTIHLAVADDGVGMPPDVMTGPLLDFGQSFWNSEQAAEKYPGLLSDPSFRPTGKFGIGFYAVFMIADDVKVISRPWQRGQLDAKVLHFRGGVNGRAELRDYNSLEDKYFFPADSTVVVAKIKIADWLKNLADRSSRNIANLDDAEIPMYLERTLKQLVFALDVECHLSIRSGSRSKINHPGIMEASSEEFVQKYNEILAADGRFERIEPEEIPLLDGIADKQGRIHTRCCISLSDAGTGLMHIGGFMVFGMGEGCVHGLSERRAETAGRSAGARVASREQHQHWGNEQLRRILCSDLSLEQRAVGTSSLCAFGIDIRACATLYNLEELVEIRKFISDLPKKARLFVSLERHRFHWNELEISSPAWWKNWHGLIYQDFNDLRFDRFVGFPNTSNSRTYRTIEGPFDAPKNENSAYAVLIHTLKEYSYNISVGQPSEQTVASYIGPEGGRGDTLYKWLAPGFEFKMFGITIDAVRAQ